MLSLRLNESLQDFSAALGSYFGTITYNHEEISGTNNQPIVDFVERAKKQKSTEIAPNVNVDWGDMPEGTMQLEFEFESEIKSDIVSFLMKRAPDLLPADLLNNLNLSSADCSNAAKLSGAVHRIEHVFAERRLKINETGTIDVKNGATSEDSMTYSFSCVGYFDYVMKQFKILIEHLFNDACPRKVDKKNALQAMMMVCNENMLKKNYNFLNTSSMTSGLFEEGFTDTFGHLDSKDLQEFLVQQLTLTNILIAFFPAHFNVKITQGDVGKINFKEKITEIVNECLSKHLSKCNTCKQLREVVTLEEFARKLEKINFDDDIKIFEGFKTVIIPSLTSMGTPIAMIAVQHKSERSFSSIMPMTLQLGHKYILDFSHENFSPNRFGIGNTVSVYRVSIRGVNFSFSIQSNVTKIYEAIKEHIKRSCGNKDVKVGMTVRSLPYSRKVQTFPDHVLEILLKMRDAKQNGPVRDLKIELVKNLVPSELLNFRCTDQLVERLMVFMDFNNAWPCFIELFYDLCCLPDVINLAHRIESGSSESYLQFFNACWKDNRIQWLQDPKIRDKPYFTKFLEEHCEPLDQPEIYYIPATVTVIKLHVISSDHHSFELQLLAKLIFYKGRSIFRSDLGIGYNAALNAPAEDGHYCILFTCPTINLELAFGAISVFLNRLNNLKPEKFKNFMLVENILGNYGLQKELEELYKKVKESGFKLQTQNWKLHVKLFVGALARAGQSPNDQLVKMCSKSETTSRHKLSDKTNTLTINGSII